MAPPLGNLGKKVLTLFWDLAPSPGPKKPLRTNVQRTILPEKFLELIFEPRK